VTLGIRLSIQKKDPSKEVGLYEVLAGEEHHSLQYLVQIIVGGIVNLWPETVGIIEYD